MTAPTREAAFSGTQVYPTEAECLVAEVKGVAPAFSMARRIAIDDISTADLKVKNLFAKAAPFSWYVSEDDPPLGKVRDTVDNEEPSSVTTIKPLDNLVISAVPTFDCVGVVFGMSGNSSIALKRAENSLRLLQITAARFDIPLADAAARLSTANLAIF